MEALLTAAKVENVVVAKLKHATAPITMRMFLQCVELTGVKDHKVKFQLDKLKREGLVRSVPVVIPNTADRVGFEWVTGPKLPPPVKALVDEVRLKINDDHSITITTPKIRVTIEVPK